MFGSLFSNKSKEKKFWEWFGKNQERYLQFEKDQDNLFRALLQELKKINKDLTFEFSPVLDDGKREFVISADGIRSAFPAVLKLAEEAPQFEKWIIIPFRQPHPDLSSIIYKDIKLDFGDVYFRYAKDSGKIGIELNMRGYINNNDWGAASFILLDALLGEYDTEMYLGWISHCPLDERNIPQLHPITELPGIIAKHKEAQHN